MKTWVAAFIRFLCLVHASYCMKGSSTEADSREELKNEDNVTTEAAKPNHKAVQPGETYIIIILAVFVGILFLALVGACIIIFLQRRRWIQRHTNPLELPAHQAINTGEDNVVFEIEDVEEDSGHEIPPQAGEDNPSITEDEAGPTGRTRRPRVHFARCPDGEQSTVDIINQPNGDDISHNELNDVDGYSVSTVAPHGCLANVVGEDDTDETNANTDNSETLACDYQYSEKLGNSKPTDMNPYNGYQNIDPDGRLIPIVESEDNPYDNVTFTHNSDVRFSSSSSDNDNVTFTHNSRQFSNSSNGNDNVTIPNSGVQLSSSSSDNDDYIHMFTVQRTRDDPPLPVSSLMTGSQSDIFTENSILPHHGLEEDRPQSGKSSSGNSSN